MIDHLPSGRHLKRDVSLDVWLSRRQHHYCLPAEATQPAEPPPDGNLHATQSGPWCWADIQSCVPLALSNVVTAFPRPFFHSSLIPPTFFSIHLSFSLSVCHCLSSFLSLFISFCLPILALFPPCTVSFLLYFSESLLLVLSLCFSRSSFRLRRVSNNNLHLLANMMNTGEISGSHEDENEDDCLLGYCLYH
jgi:hypothetical protein